MMKKLLLCVVFVCTMQFSNAQFALGDIAFSAYNSDTTVPAGTNNDAFTIVLLRSVTSGEQIAFTENGWFAVGGFRNNENTITFTFTNNYSLGTQISISAGPLEARDQNNAIAGTITGTGLSLATGGDQIFAYNPSNMPTMGDESGFIAAIHMNGAWNADATSSSTSAQPSVFTDGVNSISINPEVDNARLAAANCNNYTTLAELRTLLNTASNWEVDGAMGFPQIPPVCDFVGTLSINNFDIDANISIYPNPVGNTLNIKLPSGVNASEVKIFDINGKLVITKSEGLESLDVTTLEQGMYFVQVLANQQSYMKKIVKN